MNEFIHVCNLMLVPQYKESTRLTRFEVSDGRAALGDHARGFVTNTHGRLYDKVAQHPPVHHGQI